MKTINNNTLETMNAPQVLSENEMQNVSGGFVVTSIVYGAIWGGLAVGFSYLVTNAITKKTTGKSIIEICKGK